MANIDSDSLPSDLIDTTIRMRDLEERTRSSSEALYDMQEAECWVKYGLKFVKISDPSKRQHLKGLLAEFNRLAYVPSRIENDLISTREYTDQHDPTNNESDKLRLEKIKKLEYLRQQIETLLTIHGEDAEFTDTKKRNEFDEIAESINQDRIEGKKEFERLTRITAQQIFPSSTRLTDYFISSDLVESYLKSKTETWHRLKTQLVLS